MNFKKLKYFITECFLHSVLSGADNFFNLSICFYLFYTARKSILSQLFRQSAGYVFCMVFYDVLFFLRLEGEICVAYFYRYFLKRETKCMKFNFLVKLLQKRED